MKLLTRLGLLAILGFGAAAPAGAQAPASAEDTMTITTANGDIVIGLRPDLAPQHVARIKALAAAGEYDNVVFHRVIEGFMAQTGDVAYGDAESFSPAQVGTGGSDQPDLPAEFSNETFDRGTVGMARSQDPNSANSQFFIMLADGDFLDGQYTIVGDVVSGMDVVDQIKKGDQSDNGKVAEPDAMVSVRVGS